MSAEPFFDSDDIADLREVAESAMQDRFTCYAPPASTAASKGEDSSAAAYPADWTLIASNVRCNLNANIRQSREALAAGRLQAVGDWTINSPAGNTWRSGTAYAVGDVVVPSVETGRRYVVKTAGTSGAVAPTWPATLHGEVTNGSVVFKEFSIGSSYRIRITTKANRDFEVTKAIDKSLPSKIPIECNEIT